jgi:hypothetical protein
MDYFIEEINSINSKFTKFIDENIVLQAKIKELESNITKLNQECENYNKVSVVKNLHNQIFEKDNFIKLLERKISKLTNESNLKLEIHDHTLDAKDEAEEEAEAEADEVEADEVEVDEADEADEDEADEEAEADEADADEAEEEAEEAEDEDEAEEEAEDEDEAEVEVVEVEEEVDEDEADEDEVDVDEDEADEDEADEAEVDEEEEVDFIEKKLKPPNCKSRKLKIYLITDDEYKDIYERMDDGEAGDHVGKLVGTQNKPFFFVNKI